MPSLSRLLAVGFCLTFVAPSFSAEGDWPGWRGPNSDGISPEATAPPTSWSSTENVIWKTLIPGRGHSSPIVVNDRVILTTADEQRAIQSVLCYDRRNGKQLWDVPINKAGQFPRIHPKNTHASPTPASDGERVFVTFNHHDLIHLVALDLNGKGFWQKKVAGFAPQKYKYGYAASPIIYGSFVIVSAETEAESSITAFDRTSGQEVWRIQRPRNISYSTPIIGRVAGKDQLLISGAGQLTSYDPKSGRQLWAAQGIATVTCGTAVWTDSFVVASGGYPQRETLAVKGDGSVAWRNRMKCYEQSMLIHDGHIYAFDDGGVAYCLKIDDGEDTWGAQRLGGPVSASPVLAGGHLYFANERGKMFVVKADPERFQLVATNQLGDESFASPAISKGQLFWRVADRSGGNRQEYLYCIGTAKP